MTEYQKITKKELINKLSELGYTISEKDSFNYFNSYNAIKYKARSCYIIEKDTGLSFANIHARRDSNFLKLQEFRDNEFIINGRVYEL